MENRILYVTHSTDKNIDFIQSISGIQIDIIGYNAKQVKSKNYSYLYLREPYRLDLYLDEVNSLYKNLPNTANLTIFDGVNTPEKFIRLADKYHQFENIGDEFMPYSTINSEEATENIENFIAKKRMSGRSADIIVTPNKSDLKRLSKSKDWVYQRKIIDISKEYRVLCTNNNILPIGTLKSSKITQDSKVKVLDKINLSPNVIGFSEKVIDKLQTSFGIGDRNVLGLDVIENKNGKLYLIEINRSPIVSSFVNKTGINPYEISFLEK